MRRFKVPVLVFGLAAMAGLLAPALVHAETSPLLSEGFEQAAAQGKPLLVDFYTDW